MKRAAGRKVLGPVGFQAAALFVLLSCLPAWGAQSQNCLIRVRPVDRQGPVAVADLSAVATVNEGQVLLTWTAPVDPPNRTVQAYDLRYSTDAVAGNASAWWSAATPYLPMAAHTPSSPGSSEVFLVDGLTGGATYYFALRSVDANANWSDLDDASLGGSQAAAYPRWIRPAPVAGLAAFVNPDTSYNVDWNPVSTNEDGTPATDVTDYVVRRSGSLTGPFDVIVSSGAGANSFSYNAVTSPTLEYLQVVARDASGNESNPGVSNLLEVTPQGIIGQIAMANDGSMSRVYAPSTLMTEMRTQNGDLLMRLSPNTDPNLNRDPRTLATYDVGFISPAQVVDKSFTFSRPAMNVVLNHPVPAAAGAEVGVLWWNGTAWLKLGQAESNDIDGDGVNDTLSFRTALPGTYQVRAFQAATGLTLDKANVFPRIFSPNGDGINDVVYFVIENPKDSPVDGKIYDMSAGEVADIRPAGAGAPTPDSLVWNGRDRNGNLVPAGVYIYRIKGEGKTMTGTVVVAK